MKKDLHLIASVDKPDVLESIIEQLATRRYDIGYGKAVVMALPRVDVCSFTRIPAPTVKTARTGCAGGTSRSPRGQPIRSKNGTLWRRTSMPP